MKSKKMTLKEFKEALERVGWSFENGGWERILNEIACGDQLHAKEMRSMGLNAGARGCEDQAMKIYDILNARGYYD